MEFHTNWRISRIMKWLTAEPARRGKVSPPTGADEAFIHTIFNQIEGWCRHEAAYLTCCLMASQKQAGLSQGVVEIGVWKGKYLSVPTTTHVNTGSPSLESMSSFGCRGRMRSMLWKKRSAHSMD